MPILLLTVNNCYSTLSEGQGIFPEHNSKNIDATFAMHLSDQLDQQPVLTMHVCFWILCQTVITVNSLRHALTKSYIEGTVYVLYAQMSARKNAGRVWEKTAGDRWPSTQCDCPLNCVIHHGQLCDSFGNWWQLLCCCQKRVRPIDTFSVLFCLNEMEGMLNLLKAWVLVCKQTKIK